MLLGMLLSTSPAIAQSQDGRPIVILLTVDMVYAGTLDDESPRFETPALLGLYENEEGMLAMTNALEIVFLNVFYHGIGIKPDAQMVILAIPPDNPREAWLKIATILFDKFHVPSLYIHEAGNWDDAITPELTPGDKLYWISEQASG